MLAWPSPEVLTTVPSSAASPTTTVSSNAADPAAAARGGQAERGSRAGDERSSLSADPSQAPSVDAAAAAERTTGSQSTGSQSTGSQSTAGKSTTKKGASENADKAVAKVERRLDLTPVGSRYAETSLNLRTGPDADARVVDAVKASAKLKITKTVEDGFRLVVVDGKGRWVKNAYLSTKKPAAQTSGISDAACPSGSGVESGLTRDAVRVHRALCARFPQISSFGGVRASADFHGTGQAVDAMISESSVGWQIAKWVRANAKRLGVSEVIYSQQIWTVQRSGEGWRGMSDRGSATANHYDHVHVSVYGSAGTG